MENGSQNHSFFAYLAEGVVSLMNDILKEGGLSLFRKANEVELASGSSMGSANFQLHLLKKSEPEDSKGTFSINSGSASASDRVVVFRNPTRIAVTFALVAQNLPAEKQLRAMDKLSTFFFDNRSVEPFVPPGYGQYPQLMDKLKASKAEFKLSIESPFSSTQTEAVKTFCFAFDYLALYHSGNPLREERIAKQRVIEYSTDPSERSVQ